MGWGGPCWAAWGHHPMVGWGGPYRAVWLSPLHAHQVLEERGDLAGEDGQVEEAGGELVVVLGEVVVAKVLQGFTVLLLIFHMGCAKGGGRGHSEAGMAPGDHTTRCHQHHHCIPIHSS